MVAALLSCILGDDFGVFGMGQCGLWAFSAHAVSFQLDAVGVVDDAVEDGIGDGGFADHLMPTRDGQLGRDDG